MYLALTDHAADSSEVPHHQEPCVVEHTVGQPADINGSSLHAEQSGVSVPSLACWTAHG